MKMEPDREIESSETEMETDEETFERDASAVPEDRLVKKRNAKAAVWRYFGLETESGMVKDPDLPVCRVCHVCVKTKHANTSKLYSHLKKHHPIEYQAVRPKRNDKGKGKASLSTTRECTIEESFKLATKLRSDSREHKELTKAVTYYLAKDMRPAYSVELPGFRSMVSKLNPRYCLPGRNYFSRTGIPTLLCITKFRRKLSES